LNGFHHVRERQSVCRKIDPAAQAAATRHAERRHADPDSHGHTGKGYTLDGYMDARLVPFMFAVDYECVRRARPVYTIAYIDDIYGRVVADERLMLSYPDDGAVTSAIASPKTIELAAQWTGPSNRRHP
jgi:hypothetical protein